MSSVTWVSQEPHPNSSLLYSYSPLCTTGTVKGRHGEVEWSHLLHKSMLGKPIMLLSTDALLPCAKVTLKQLGVVTANLSGNRWLTSLLSRWVSEREGVDAGRQAALRTYWMEGFGF